MTKRELETLDRIAWALERIATVACWSASAYLRGYTTEAGDKHIHSEALKLGDDQLNELELYESRDRSESIANSAAVNP